MDELPVRRSEREKAIAECIKVIEDLIDRNKFIHQTSGNEMVLREAARLIKEQVK